MYLLLCSNKSILLLTYYPTHFHIRRSTILKKLEILKMAKIVRRHTVLRYYQRVRPTLSSALHKWCVFLNPDQGYYDSFQSEKLTRFPFDLKYASAHHSSRVKNPELLGSVLRGVNE